MVKMVNSYEDIGRNMFFKLKEEEGSRNRGHNAALVKVDKPLYSLFSCHLECVVGNLVKSC